MKISSLIIYYIVMIVTAIIMLKAYGAQDNKKLDFNLKNILIILIISLVNTINNIFMFVSVRLLITDILIFTMCKLIFKDSSKRTLYYTLIICITLLLLELVSSIFIPLLVQNIDAFNNSTAFKVGLTILLNIILYAILTRKVIINFFKMLRETVTKRKMIYVIAFISFITCNLWLIYIGTNSANRLLNVVISFTEIFIIILLLAMIKNKHEKTILKIKEDQMKQNLNLYSKVAGEYKELKHNLMNDFLIIKTKLPKKDQEFINDIINKYKSNYEWVNDITDVPEGLQGLVFLKKNQAELKKITFNLEYTIKANIEKSFDINTNFKLYETLGILYDNAIEAACESEQKVINTVFSYQKNTLRISICNTFSNDIDLDKIGTKNYSTKNRGSGIGLHYLRKFKNKFKIQQSIRENIFITDVIIN